MEHYDPSRRQYAPTSYPAQQPQQTAPQTAGPYGTPGSAERFRQTNYMQQSPTAAQTSSRASHDAQQLYNFSQGVQYATGSSLPATQMQYGQDYSAQEPRQQTQQYQQYGTGAVYGGSIQQGQQQVQSAYDQVPTFRQSRTGAASETLPSQFGDAPTAQYYLAGQSVPSSAPPTEMAAPQLPSQYSQSAYAQSGSSAQQSYGMLDPAQSAAYSAYNQQSQYATPQPPQQQSETVDQLFNQYQISIRTIFTRTREGDLRDTPDQLIRISQYLLGRAEALGLTRDDEALHDDRIRLWDEFNRAWLATLQRQHDLTQDMLQRGQALHESQSLISTQALEQLARELVRLCDEVEKHGLVDYQMGVAEEEIMNPTDQKTRPRDLKALQLRRQDHAEQLLNTHRRIACVKANVARQYQRLGLVKPRSPPGTATGRTGVE